MRWLVVSALKKFPEKYPGNHVVLVEFLSQGWSIYGLLSAVFSCFWYGNTTCYPRNLSKREAPVRSGERAISHLMFQGLFALTLVIWDPSVFSPLCEWHRTRFPCSILKLDSQAHLDWNKLWHRKPTSSAWSVSSLADELEMPRVREKLQLQEIQTESYVKTGTDWRLA